MKIVVISKKPVLTPQGRLPAGSPVDVPPALAKFLIDRGEAVLFEVKELMDRPQVAVGETLSSSASQAAQALPKTTLKQSEDGVKKRGRSKKME